jgi:hypothetical protein
MSKSSIRRKLQNLREQLCPQQPVIIGVSVDTRTGQLRSILWGDCVNRPAPSDLRVEDLPRGCLIHRYDPSREAAILYRSTADGHARVQRVLGVNEDIVTGRAPCWDAPMSEWPAIFAGQHEGGDRDGRAVD